MKRESKDEMIEGALRLLAQHGLQATSFSEVLALTGAPRGSIYHHFPKGKEELVVAALSLSETRTTKAINNLAGTSPDVITDGFLGLWRQLLVTSNYTAGCSAVAVTVATDSKQLLERATSIFRSWQHALANLLMNTGLSEQAATEFATMLIAASEGGVVMARAEKSLEPFEQVARSLLKQAQTLSVDK